MFKALFAYAILRGILDALARRQVWSSETITLSSPGTGSS